MSPDPPLRVRRATAADYDALDALAARCVAPPWLASSRAQAPDGELVLLAERPPGILIGYAAGELLIDTHHLARIGLDPAACQPGDLGALVAAFVAESRRGGALEVVMEAMRGDADVLLLCEEAGFRLIPRRVGEPPGPGRAVQLSLGASEPFSPAPLAELRLAPRTSEQERVRARVAELLTSGDRALVEQGLEVVKALQDPALCDALLEGVELRGTFGGDVFRIGGIFESRSSLGFENFYALLRLVKATRALSTRAQRLIRLMPESFTIDGGMTVYGEDGAQTQKIRTHAVDLEGIDAFPGIRVVELLLCEEVRGLRSVANLPNLERLVLHGTPPIPLAELAGAPLKELHCYVNAGSIYPHQAAPLGGIERLPRLEALSVAAEARPIYEYESKRRRATYESMPTSPWLALRDLSPLAECRGLRSLLLQGNPGLSIGPLLELRGLERLKLGGFGVEDAAFLAHAPGLKHLSFVSCASLRDISALERLPLLEVLELSSCPNIESYEVLERLPALRRLYMDGPQQKLLQARSSSFLALWRRLVTRG